MNQTATPPTRIMVVDDDDDMRSVLKCCFESEGFSVIEAETAEQVTAQLTPAIDLITLDLKLPGDDGLNIAKEIRSRSEVPIIMVTGKGDPVDRIVGLEIGADDYITKPFHVREVLARVRSVLRRSQMGCAPKVQQDSSRVFTFGDWLLDLERYELRSRHGELCDATTGQLKLLEVLIENRNRVLSRDQIMNHLRGVDWAPNDRSIDNRIAALRRIIEQDPKKPQFIKTVFGMGYRFDAVVETVNDTPAPAQPVQRRPRRQDLAS